MNGPSAKITVGSSLRYYQFSLRTLTIATAVIALFAWNYARFGSLLLLGLVIAVPVGCVSGALVGLFHRAVRRGTLGGICGAILSIAVVVVWWQVQIVTHGEAERYRGAPMTAFFHPEILLSLTFGAFFGSVLISAVVIVHDRSAMAVACLPMITCATTTFLAGMAFFAYDVWSRGRFPRPPLPWPIALAISLGSAVFVAAWIGFASGLIWLGVRFIWRFAVARIAERKSI